MGMENEKKIILKGTPYEIGFQHGEAVKEKIHTSIQTYAKMFEDTAFITWQQAIEKAKQHLDAIEKYNSRYLDEMEGLAKGAGVTFEDILALNARSEIALTNAPDGCTTFALSKPKTTKTWLAQNWDWRASQVDSLVYLQIEQEGLPIIEMITEAGIIGKIGCNSAGVGVGLNALITNVWGAKVPIHLGLRAILESTSLKEAVKKVDHNQMASPAHFMIASAAEGMVSMEVSPIQTDTIQTVNGMLTHTNHLCSANMLKLIQETPIPDSTSRLETIDRLVEGIDKRDLTADDFFHVLANHEGYPSSICRHPDPTQPIQMQTRTVFSIAMNLTDRKLTWLKGNPCEHGYGEGRP